MSEDTTSDKEGNGNANGKQNFRREIVLVGNKNACGYCFSGDRDLREAAKKNPSIHYRYVPIESEEGERILEEEGVKPERDEDGNEIFPMPFIKDCKVNEKGETVQNSCRKIEGYKKSDWRDLDSSEFPSLD